MNDILEPQLEALRRQPPDRLPGLEGAVWTRIAALRDGGVASRVLLPLRAASVAAALGLGLLGGRLATGAIEPAAPEISVFSVDARLAPSTLLGGR